MDFSLTPEQRAIQALAREVADAEIAPHAAAWDRDHTFPRELFTKLGELGLMGVCVPEELGGAGADFISYILVLEELSRADAGRRRHGRGAHERRDAPDPRLRHATSSGSGSCPTSRPAACSARSRSPSPTPDRTRARCAHRPWPTVTAGG